MEKLKFVGTLLAFTFVIFAIGSVKSSASTIDLSEAQKLDYYNQYLEIVEQINSEEYNSTLELGPFEGFSNDAFIKPSEFKAYALERANVKFNIVSDSNFNNNITPTKTKSVTSNGAGETLNIKHSFNTQYSSIALRQLFAGINYITVTPSKGIWAKSTSSGYSARLIDGGRTYEVTASGKLTMDNLSSSHNVVVEFYCTAEGNVK